MASYWQRSLDTRGITETLRFVNKRIRQVSRLKDKKGKKSVEVRKYKTVLTNLESWKQKITKK